MLPVGVLFAASDEELLAAKDEFNTLWHSAAETTKKRSALEETLAQFDSKVADAKKDLATAAEKRKAVREQIAAHKTLVDTLQGQIAAAAEAKAFYTAVASSQKEDFADFVRYMVVRNIVDEESGPAAAPLFMKHIFRGGSLGESIDDQMAREAVLRARERFFDQARVLVQEADRIDLQLHASASEIAAEINVLEKEYGSISSTIDEKSEFIDNSWKEKKLTQEELADIAAEAAEVSARIATMQASLLKINDELKAGKIAELQAQRDAFQQEQDALEAKRSSILLKDQAMVLLEENALRAFQDAIHAKNTDKKLYVRIEQLSLKRANSADALALLESDDSGSGSDTLKNKIRDLREEIAYDDEVLSRMKEGIPQDKAEAYVKARHQADEAKLLREDYAKQIGELNVAIAEKQQEVSVRVKKIDEVARAYELSDLPPLFVWPVNGPVTAGYLDAAYVTVFGVPHRAVDIAVPQATAIRAISDGIVFAVKDGGARGYSYVLIAHRNGYASLYGHVSSSLVAKGDIVNAGQIIALSGGKPGTHGAGPMTTGAHVHLEITKDGAHIDPQTVLPRR